MLLLLQAKTIYLFIYFQRCMHSFIKHATKDNKKNCDIQGKKQIVTIKKYQLIINITNEVTLPHHDRSVC